MARLVVSDLDERGRFARLLDGAGGDEAQAYEAMRLIVQGTARNTLAASEAHARNMRRRLDEARGRGLLALG